MIGGISWRLIWRVDGYVPSFSYFWAVLVLFSYLFPRHVRAILFASDQSLTSFVDFGYNSFSCSLVDGGIGNTCIRKLNLPFSRALSISSWTAVPNWFVRHDCGLCLFVIEGRLYPVSDHWFLRSCIEWFRLTCYWRDLELECEYENGAQVAFRELLAFKMSRRMRKFAKTSELVSIVGRLRLDLGWCRGSEFEAVRQEWTTHMILCSWTWFRCYDLDGMAHFVPSHM